MKPTMEEAHEISQDETQMSVEVRLVYNLLGQANEALDSNDLEKAQDLFEKALAVKGKHPERPSTIRRDLKLYSDKLADQDLPEWENSHRALDLIGALKLQDEATAKWQRDLWLKEASFHLRQEDLDQSFDIFRQLQLMAEEQGEAEAEELKGEISGIVRRNLLEEAEDANWSLMRKTIEEFKPLWHSGDELSEWLETISGTLVAIDQATDQAQKELEQERRRNRSLALAVIAIIAVAVILYAVLIIISAI